MMKNKEIKQIFYELSSTEQEKILEDLLQERELKGEVQKQAAIEIQKSRNKKPCPHCKCDKTHKRGFQNKLQMYVCTECKKWYNETTGTPLHGIHLKTKWQSYLKCMEQGMAIKSIAKELKISIQTSFDWRHKILSSLSSLVPEKLEGKVECDELELALNEKGSHRLKRKARKRGSDSNRNKDTGALNVVQVVTAIERDSKKSMYFRVAETKRLSELDVKKALDGKLNPGTTLITDKHSAYRAFSKSNKDITHHTLKASDHVDKNNKNIHLQTVNNTHFRLRKFLTPFNGVSTKYLQNYLNWFAYSSKLREHKAILRQWFITILMTDTSYSLFELFKENAVNIRT
jgi:transposase-like protein